MGVVHDPSKKGGKIQFILILISGAEFLNKLGSSIYKLTYYLARTTYINFEGHANR